MDHLDGTPCLHLYVFQAHDLRPGTCQRPALATKALNQSHTADDINPALRTLNYGIYGIFLIIIVIIIIISIVIMGNAGYIYIYIYIYHQP